MMRRPEQSVVWSEGLPLGPVHLQQLDRYHEALLGARLDAVLTSTWGLVRMELDRTALAKGSLRLERFAGVLPGGTALVFDDDESLAPPIRPVEGFTADRVSIDIFLGVIRQREGLLQVGDEARFVGDRRTMHDVHTREVEPTEVELARPNVRFLFGHESRSDYECFKIAEVRRDSTGACVLDEGYIPPSLQVRASDALIGRLERLITLAETRRTALLASRRERDADTVEADASDVTRFALLHALSQALPGLHHVYQSRDLAPRLVYLRLLDLLGSLSTFSMDATLEAPPFDHSDLRSTFSPLFERLELLLAASHRETCFVLPLSTRDDGLHYLELDEKITRCTRFLISIKAPVGHQETATQAPITGKVASYEQINQVVSSALPGARLSVAHRPPPEVPVRSDEVYFTVETSDAYWKKVVADKNLAVFLPHPFLPTQTKVQLLAIPARVGANGAAQPLHPFHQQSR